MFVLGGVAVGATAVAFAILADRAQHEFAELLALGRFWPLLVTPLGFVLTALATNRFFPGSQGSGIPQVIAAHRIGATAARQKLVSLRVAAGKILLTAFGLLFGASTGREGPTVQVGAALMFAVGRLSPLKQSGLIVAGAAAGVAAAFNTPIAGIIFGIEELTRTFERRTSGLILATVVAAGSVSLLLVGNYTYFGTSTGALHGVSLWLGMPLCGVSGGLLGGAFSRLMIGVAAGNLFGPWARSRPIALAGACGVVVALVGIAAGNATYGTGYTQVKDALDGTAPIGLLFMPLKLIATLASSLSGIPGGIFSPSLAIGAGLGADVARLFSTVDVGAMMLLGMVGLSVRRRAGADHRVRDRDGVDQRPRDADAADVDGVDRPRHRTSRVPRRYLSRARAPIPRRRCGQASGEPGDTRRIGRLAAIRPSSRFSRRHRR